MMLTQTRLLGAVVAVLLPLAPAYAFDVSWNVVAGGGGTSSNGQYTLSGTAGQAAASAPHALTNANSKLTEGFWVTTLPVCASFARADFNCDCVVDFFDLLIFQACTDGPAVSYAVAGLPQGCTLTANSRGYITADFDHDRDVDQRDFAVFQRCYSGPSKPADPSCAN